MENLQVEIKHRWGMWEATVENQWGSRVFFTTAESLDRVVRNVALNTGQEVVFTGVTLRPL